MTQVKICGIQEPADALEAADAGADLLGLVFVPGRSRQVNIDKARVVVESVQDTLRPSPTMVGLFANQAIDEVNQTLQSTGLEMAQLCGREDPAFCAQVAVPVIKMLHVPQSQSVEEAVYYLGHQAAVFTRLGHWITLDREVEGLQGGTGERFNWEIARRLSLQGFHFMLAGGLSADNVAYAIRTVGPWAVDVSSGVETAGRKDSAKVRSFIQQVNAVDERLDGQ